MSRSGYTEDYENNWELIKWRGQVASSIRGKRGQALLRKLNAALEALPTKALIKNAFVEQNGQVCTLGCVAQYEGIDLSDIDPDDAAYECDKLAARFNAAEPLLREVMYENDDGGYNETPESRYYRMLKWVRKQIR